MALTGRNQTGIITPFGGVAFLLGWLCLASWRCGATCKPKQARIEPGHGSRGMAKRAWTRYTCAPFPHDHKETLPIADPLNWRSPWLPRQPAQHYPKLLDTWGWTGKAYGRGN